MVDKNKLYDKKEAEIDEKIAQLTISKEKEFLEFVNQHFPTSQDRDDDIKKMVKEHELKIKDPFDYHKLQEGYNKYKKGEAFFDPMEIYWMNIKLQYCKKHYQSSDYMTICINKFRITGVHMQSLLFDVNKMVLYLIHRTDKIDLPLAAKDLDRLNDDMYEKINFLSDTNISETFKGEYYSWYFCAKCISLDEIKDDITKPNWYKDIQAKYGYIWIDWNLNK